MCLDDEAQLVLFTALDVIEYARNAPSQSKICRILIIIILATRNFFQSP
jgi:hypothetical protein